MLCENNSQKKTLDMPEMVCYTTSIELIFN